MKQVLNKTRRPVKVPLPGGRVLHLGPAKTGQVPDNAVEAAGFVKLRDAGVIELLDGGGPTRGSGDDSGTLQESTQGHPQTTVVLPKGNR